jgi:hypothetical protein
MIDDEVRAADVPPITRAVRFLGSPEPGPLDDTLTDALEKTMQPVIAEVREQDQERKTELLAARQSFWVDDDMAIALTQMVETEQQLGRRSRAMVMLENNGPYLYRMVPERATGDVHLQVVRRMVSAGLLDAFEIEVNHVGRLRLTPVGRRVGQWLIEQDRLSAHFKLESDGSLTVEPSHYIWFAVVSGTRTAPFTVNCITQNCMLQDGRSKWAEDLDDLDLDALLKVCAQQGWQVVMNE